MPRATSARAFFKQWPLSKPLQERVADRHIECTQATFPCASTAVQTVKDCISASAAHSRQVAEAAMSSGHAYPIKECT